MSTSTANAWIRGQKKADLTKIAESVGLKNYESLKKSDLETALDDFIAQHSDRLAKRSDLSGYFASRAKALGSPVKKESEVEKTLKVAKRRVTKAAEEIEDRARATSSSVLRTPARSLSQVAARIPLPATPADVAHAVDRSTLALRKRVSSVYQDSGINEASNATRETLSTVTSILFVVAAFELYHIRPEVLQSRYAFTIPAVSALHTSDYPVYLPDMFLLLTSSFWSPALTWFVTSIFVPSVAGYFFNLSHASQSGARTRARAANETTVDPLTYSIAKALITYVVYAQGVTFCGTLSKFSINRLNSAVYGGWRGVLVGTAITGLVSIYDAALRR